MTTDTQLAIDFSAPPPANANGRTIYDGFVEFHAANPQVYDALRRLALQMRRRGVQQYGIAGLYEVLRHETTLNSTGDEYKLNNSYRSFYARLLMEQEPELAGFFATRMISYQSPLTLHRGNHG